MSRDSLLSKAQARRILQSPVSPALDDKDNPEFEANSTSSISFSYPSHCSEFSDVIPNIQLIADAFCTERIYFRGRYIMTRLVNSGRIERLASGLSRCSPEVRFDFPRFNSRPSVSHQTPGNYLWPMHHDRLHLDPQR